MDNDWNNLDEFEDFDLYEPTDAGSRYDEIMHCRDLAYWQCRGYSHCTSKNYYYNTAKFRTKAKEFIHSFWSSYSTKERAQIILYIKKHVPISTPEIMEYIYHGVDIVNIFDNPTKLIPSYSNIPCECIADFISTGDEDDEKYKSMFSLGKGYFGANPKKPINNPTIHPLHTYICVKCNHEYHKVYFYPY